MRNQSVSAGELPVQDIAEIYLAINGICKPLMLKQFYRSHPGFIAVGCLLITPSYRYRWAD
jgi:hypothetical protein